MRLRWPVNKHAEGVDDANLLAGIRFTMFDGEKPVVCRVTAQALDEAKASTSETWLETFARLHDKIGQVASDHYENGDLSPAVINGEI